MKKIGLHAVTLGSIAGDQVDQLMAGQRAQVLFCDPPWGDSYLKMFATHTEKATGRRPDQVTHAELCARIAELVDRYVDGAVYIETSKKCAAEVAYHLAAVTDHVRVTPATYAGGLEHVLIDAARDGVRRPVPDVAGLKGVAFVQRVLSYVAIPGGIVLDPCCGAGYTARAALSHGMRFRGNELNPARLAKTVAFLERS